MGNVEAGRVHAFVQFGMHRGRIGGFVFISTRHELSSF